MLCNICRLASLRYKMLCLENGVFHRLAQAELDGRLGRDLDSRTGSRVATLTSFALRFLQLSEAGDGEFTIRPDLADRHLGERVEHGLYVRFLASARFRQAADDFRLCHTSHSLVTSKVFSCVLLQGVCRPGKGKQGNGQSCIS